MINHSVASRLNTEEETVKKTVENWRELFRPGINHEDANRKRIDDLISALEKIRSLTPEQIREKLDKDNLKDWCFRSQFRRTLSDPESPLEVIQLGLDYIETHRKAYHEFAETKRQQRVYLAPLLTIGGTLLLGFLTVWINFYLGYQANNLKERELDIKASEKASKQQEVAKPPSPAPPSPTPPSPAPSSLPGR